MKLLNLRGKNFRNILSLDITPSPYINVIYGDNGSGKSTLLEMIHCLSRGRSFRTHMAMPMIQYEKNYCHVFGQIGTDHVSTSIGFKKDRQGKTQLKVGYDQKAPTIKALSHILPTQLFHPESHDFLNSGPSLRRKFIDWGLFYTVPGFMALWQRFHQVLKQRNAALAHKHSEKSIRVWDIELASSGEQLSQLRSYYVDQLIEQAKDCMTLFLGNLPITLNYYAGWNTVETLLYELKRSFNKDIRYGYTTCGPHRFDLLIQSHGLSVEYVFSRGEQKRLICALYLAQGKIFKTFHNKGCLYLLDDILSELDAFYQSKVLDALMALDAQIFVTSLSVSLVQPLLSINDVRQFHLVDGVVQSSP